MSQTLPPRSDKPENESVDSPLSSEAEKNSYTLDEMMKALRDGEREKEAVGEIVTRADGSVAHKVKTRKRRSDQPENAAKPEKKKKRLLWKVIVGVSVFLLTILGALFILVGFNSKAYQVKVEERASSWTGADVELKGLKLMPGSISMNDASFQWSGTSFLKSLQLRNLTGHADLTSFLWSRLGGRELGGKVGVLELQLPTEDGSVGEALEEEDFPFNFDGYYCDSLDVNFGSESAISIKGTDVSFRHIRGDGFRLSLDQGIFALDGWEDLPIKSGLVKFYNNEVNLESMILGEPVKKQSGRSSSLKLGGMVPMGVGEKVQLDLFSDSFPMENLLGSQMGQLFSGPVGKAEGVVDFTIGGNSFESVSFSFDSYQLQMLKFPFLKDLDNMFPRENYAEIIFDNLIEGKFRADSRGVVIEGLEMSQKDILRLEGDILISKDGRIGGALSLSLNSGLINGYPEVKSLPVFAANQNKSRQSVTFKLGGTLDEPDDSFRSVVGLIGSQEDLKKDALPDIDEAWKELINGEKK